MYSNKNSKHFPEVWLQKYSKLMCIMSFHGFSSGYVTADGRWMASKGFTMIPRELCAEAGLFLQTREDFGTFVDFLR